MYTVLFIDSEYNNFNYNLLDNSSVIFTKCFDKKFLDMMYIKGLRVIHIQKNQGNKLVPEGLDIDIIVTKEDVQSESNELVYNYEKNTCNRNKLECSPVNSSINKLSELFIETNSQKTIRSVSYENLLETISMSAHKESSKFIEEVPDKFQKTMEKEAKKLKFAENREKYKQKMRQTSLSNKKSIEKLDKKSKKDSKEHKDPKDLKDSKEHK